STRLTCWLAAALVVVFGTRDVVTGRLPAVGQFAPFASWGATFGQFAAGWHPAGVGTSAPASPALALTGVLGTLLLGSMGLAQKVLVLGCLPLGPWGVVRLVRPFGSQRAALVAGLSYLAIALPYDALATGRLGALVLYAGAPWVLANLFRASRLPPYVATGAADGTGPAPGAAPTGGEGAPAGAAALTSSGRRGRRTAVLARMRRATGPAGRGGPARRHDLLSLALLEAVLVSFAPAAAIVVLLCALAVAVPLAATGGGRAARRVVGRAVGGTVLAGVVTLPWLVGVASAGSLAAAVFGVPLPQSAAVGWGSLLRFADGPVGGSVLGWGFALAAVAPLLLGRGPRFGWAARLWSVALVFWVFAWVVGRGWTGAISPDVDLLLAPAAVAVAGAIGLGISAFEIDVPRAAFGWRQLVTGLAAVATALAALPTVVSALPGAWNLPTNDFTQAVGWMHGRSADGAFRVLWLGDARAIDAGSWAAGDGLAYATSEDGPPDARWLWNQPGPGPAAGLATAVDSARHGATDRVGRELAPAGVRYVVVLTALAPQIVGEQTPASLPVPADLLPSLGRQLDLTTVLSGTGMTVFENTDWV
ncbi:MAG TPA: hypothetical protein VKW77_06940, partial [Acidimicrobiales bacterium]|nr:hypothetical protein [Acidimicrobiales bacterium]